MQHSLAVVPDELLEMCKSNKLISRNTEKNGKASMSTLLNMDQGLNAVDSKVNHDIPLISSQCYTNI